jgi:hypothetical protein
MFMVRTMSRWFELFGESQLRHAAVLGHPAAALGRGDRAHRDRGPGARDHVELRLVETQAVGEQHARAHHPDRLEIGGRAVPVPGHRLLAGLGPAVVVQGQAGAMLVRHPLERAQQLGAAGLVGERHGPGPDPTLEPPVPLLDERGGARDRLRGRIARELPRSLLVGHRLAEHHADARVLVRLQAGVGELRAARVEEAHRAVLDQLHETEQGGVILLLLGHGRL